MSSCRSDAKSSLYHFISAPVVLSYYFVDTGHIFKSNCGPSCMFVAMYKMMAPVKFPEAPKDSSL